MSVFRRGDPAMTPPLSARGERAAQALESARDYRNTLPRTQRRRFDAAVFNRLTASWVATNNAIDGELRTSIDAMRARSRDLFKNNEYAVKFGRNVRTNVVGHAGFRLQVTAKDPDGSLDTGANDALEAAFKDWGRPENCDVAGKRSFIDFQDAASLALARDGEYLIRKRIGKGAGKYGFQLQMLDVDRLDTTYNLWPADGRNAVIMGVEIDPWRKPVAYHLWNRHPTEAPSTTRVRQRIPAEQILHGYLPIEDEQARGIPWLHAVMRRMNDLNGYREAAVIASRIGASQMGFYESPDGDPSPIADGVDDEQGRAEPEFTMEAQPGVFSVLPPGYKFTSFNPDYPHQQFEAFTKAALRGITTGMPGGTYHSIANDLEGISYSSIRSGTLEERAEWMCLQRWVAEHFLVPVYEQWLDMALLRGVVMLSNGSALPIAKRDKFAVHGWKGRRWSWVDPLKDMAAAVLAIENGLSSPQKVADQMGMDIDEVIADLAAFRKKLADAGVEITGTTHPTGTVATAVKDGDGVAPAEGTQGGGGKKKGRGRRVLPEGLSVADLVALLDKAD